MAELVRPEAGSSAPASCSSAGGALARTMRELRGSRTGRLALAVLALLGAGAFFAPLLANGEPLALVAEGRAAYLRSLQVASFAATGLSAAADAADPGAIERDAAALERALGDVARALGPADRAAPDELVRLTRRARAAAGSGEREAARSAARELALRAPLLAETHAPRDPEHPERGGVALRARPSSPALASLDLVELWLLALAPIALALALARRPRAARSARPASIGGRCIGVALCIVLSLAAALALRAAAGPARADGGGATKAELAAEPLARAVFAPVPFGYAESQLAEIYRPPTWHSSAARAPASIPREVGEPAPDAAARHWLGSDSLGRDLLARILWGGRASLAIGLAAAALAALLGTALGALAGYFGGAADFAVSRTIEVVQCFPAFVLVLLAVAFTDPEIVPRPAAIVGVIALVRWTGVARLVRAELLRVRELDYVAVARAQGFPPLRVLFGHALPNAAGPAVVAASFDVSAAIVTESALSYLGFGVEQPFPSWGALLNESRNPEHWWLQLFPGLLIFATVAALNRVGEAARVALDPRAEAAR